MKQMALAILAFSMLIPAAHADGAPTDAIVDINGENIVLGSETLNFFTQEDLTTGAILENTMSLTGTGSYALNCFSWAACAADGATFQIGVFDYSIEIVGPLVFLYPNVGIYPGAIVALNCGFDTPCGLSEGNEGFILGLLPPAYGQIVVTDAPEPGIFALLLIGMVGLVGAVKRLQVV